MSRIASTAAIILALSVATARAAEDPKALLERALRASGDTPWLTNPPATFVRARGAVAMNAPRAGPGDPAMTLEIKMQPAERMWMKLGITLAAMKDSSLVVLNGAKGWRDGPREHGVELSSRDLVEIRSLGFLERLADLRELMRDRRFTFTALGESKIEGKEVSGVKIACKGREDTLLYFDKTTGLLTRARYQDRHADRAKAKSIQITFLDYREVDSGAEETAILKKAGLEATGPALIAWLRRQMPPPDALEKAKKLVQKLGDDRFAVREQASKELVQLGAIAAPLLEQARRSDDAEVARRARSCLRRMKDQVRPEVLTAVVHLLALRRPAGAASALLDYLPAAPEAVAPELRAALYHLGTQGRPPDPVLLAALKDPAPARRAAATAALGKDGGAYARLPQRRIFRPDVQRPRKMMILFENGIQLEMEIQEQRFYNRFDDKLFARHTPGTP